MTREELGRIAFDSRPGPKSPDATWDNLSQPWREYWTTIGSSVALAAMEECRRILDDQRKLAESRKEHDRAAVIGTCANVYLHCPSAPRDTIKEIKT